ncbi:MAG: MarR family winged helix-turn-helix transcriptional regulator [Rhodobacter sp.]|nr:MarR family winged helix-turn-helix transcriptional regulator [Rhodobacter sp.]
METAADEKLGVYNVPLREMLTYRLSRLNAKMNAQATRILKKSSGLSQAQWRVLVMIDAFGPVPPAQIVRTSLMDKGQLSRTIKGMVTRGLIRLEASESDHRSHLLCITDRGRDLFERARPAMLARQTRLSGNLDEGDRAAFHRVLDRLEDAVEAVEAAE